jgi:hypothetical protein
MAIKNLAKTYSAELEGVNAKLIEVETDMNVGLREFKIAGKQVLQEVLLVNMHSLSLSHRPIGFGL